MAPSPLLAPDLPLTQRQEELLFAALTSNSHGAVDGPYFNAASSRGAFSNSLAQAGASGDGEYIDFDRDFEADGDNTYATGAEFDGESFLPDFDIDEHVDNGTHDKRHLDEDDEAVGSGKRRDSGGKTAKKPGRKLITGEATTVSLASPV